jgi:hypothetical protein
MMRPEENSEILRNAPPADCAGRRSEFSSYLDGALTGVQMVELSSHLEVCKACAADFSAWRIVQRCLGELRAAQPPERLQSHLQQTLAAERERGTFLPWHRRLVWLWQRSVAPMALQFGGGLAAAILLAGSLSWMFGAPITVQANDDEMAHLVAPQYLYSQVPPEKIKSPSDLPIVVEAMVDSKGRVYDYSILDGPQSPQVRVAVENNLLGSVFRPATAFGVAVRGHVVMTYTGVSVRG